MTPASTFKIAISLMGYDSGFLKDEHAPALPFRQGYPDWNPSWKTTTDPTSWIRNSVVWYSQQVTRSLGAVRFRRYATAFHYGNEDVSGDPGRHDGLTPRLARFVAQDLAARTAGLPRQAGAARIARRAARL